MLLAFYQSLCLFTVVNLGSISGSQPLFSKWSTDYLTSVKSFVQYHTIKEFNVAKAWSKCEDTFCVDYEGGRWSTFCSLHEKPITFSYDEACVNPGGRSTVSISLSTWIVDRRSMILGVGPWELCSPTISVQSN